MIIKDVVTQHQVSIGFQQGVTKISIPILIIAEFLSGKGDHILDPRPFINYSIVLSECLTKCML